MPTSFCSWYYVEDFFVLSVSLEKNLFLKILTRKNILPIFYYYLNLRNYLQKNNLCSDAVKNFSLNDQFDN